jgi:hypothetical protein
MTDDFLTRLKEANARRPERTIAYREPPDFDEVGGLVLHEAAHAVIGDIAGVPPERIRIRIGLADPGSEHEYDYEGSVAPPAGIERVGQWSNPACFAMVMQCLAGPMLDELLDLTDHRLTGYGGEDEAKAEQWLNRVRDEDRSEARGKLTDATRRLVREQLPHIKAVATGVLRKLADVRWEEEAWPVVVIVEGDELRALLANARAAA